MSKLIKTSYTTFNFMLQVDYPTVGTKVCMSKTGFFSYKDFEMPKFT